MNDLISRQAEMDAVNGIIDRFEKILRNIRESKLDDSVCGMCEYDGAFIGQSGDWCNECPGFYKDDCFKLSDKCRKKWLESVEMPSASHLGGTAECKLAKDTSVPNKVLMGEWISVSKKLPTNDDWVIVTILDERGDTPFRYTDFGWYLEVANRWIVGAEQRTDVTAWMSLPKPWKGEEDAD